MLFRVYLELLSKLVRVGLGFISGYNMRIQIIVNVCVKNIYIYIIALLMFNNDPQKDTKQ